MSYYLVKCKFGHVGRNMYLPLIIPVVADTVKEAIYKASNTRGVKKSHKDWCLESPKKVDFVLFEKTRNKLDNDIYFEKHSRSRLYLFENRLIEEPNYSRINGIKTNKLVYTKQRNKETLKFKRKKEELIIKELIKEQMMGLMSQSKQYRIVLNKGEI